MIASIALFLIADIDSHSGHHSGDAAELDSSISIDDGVLGRGVIARAVSLR
jgi:hypothetical protein